MKIKEKDRIKSVKIKNKNGFLDMRQEIFFLKLGSLDRVGV